jgi:hypothetical protein
MFILDFKLVFYVDFRFQFGPLYFNLGLNLVLSVSFVTCGKRFTYMNKHVDTLTLGHVSKLNGVNDKTDGNDQIKI